MARPSGGYYVGDTRVPSVTTILGRFKEAGGLMHWAWDLGMQGVDYRQVRDEAASAGTVAHAMVEAWLKGESHIEVDATPEAYEKAKNAYQQFCQWAAQSRLKIIQTETSLVSPTHMYGGTMDAISIDGDLALLDWKSSNHVYSDYMAQLAAYGELWNENHPGKPIAGGYHLVRFDKESAAFSHHWWGDLTDARDYFLTLRRAYDLDKALKKRM